MNIKEVNDIIRRYSKESSLPKVWDEVFIFMKKDLVQKLDLLDFSLSFLGDDDFVLYWVEQDALVTKRLQVFLTGDKPIALYTKYINDVNSCQVPLVNVGVSLQFEETWQFIFDVYEPLSQVFIEVKDEE